MQIKSLRIKSYRSWQVNDSPVSEIARKRLKKLELFQKLRAEGCSEDTALQAVETSRATIYRWQVNYNKQGIVGLNPISTAPKNKQKPKWSRAC